MTKRTRRNHAPGFKAKVALAGERLKIGGARANRVDFGSVL